MKKQVHVKKLKPRLKVDANGKKKLVTADSLSIKCAPIDGT